MDPTYPLFPVFALLGFILSLIPLPFHLQAWNSGTCYFMIWSALACLNQFVNSVVWAGNIVNHSPIFCEISTRILMGSSVAIPAASLCINRRLYHIASVQAVSTTRSEKRRDILIDTAICVLFPMLFIALQYVVQGHRFNIFEDLGCRPAIYNTLPAYFISYSWPIIIGSISLVYCSMTLASFFRRRIQFNQFLSSNKSLTSSRYFRLMALATTEIVFTIPFAALTIWVNTVASPVHPWISWEDTHYGFSRIDYIPAVVWRSNPRAVLAAALTQWLTPFCAFVFFGFFGFADEAKKRYKQAFWAVVKALGFKPKPRDDEPKGHMLSIGHFKKPVLTPISSLPVYTPSTTQQSLKRSASLTSSFSSPCDRSETLDTWSLLPSLHTSPSLFSYDPLADMNEHRLSNTSDLPYNDSRDRTSLVSIPPVAIAI